MKQILLLSASPLLLASCLSTTFHDTLVRASLEGPIPRSPVHLPSPDSGTFQVQGNLSIDANPDPKRDVQLLDPDQKDDAGNTGHGRKVDWTHGPVTASAEASVLLGRHVRLFGGYQGDLHAKATWFGGGLSFGRVHVVELSLASGHTAVERELSGYRETVLTDDCTDGSLGCVPASSSSRGADTTMWDREDVPFTRVSATLAHRGGGPWGELAMTTFKGLAHTVEGNWDYDAESILFGAGWAFPTPYGMLAVGGRAETLGESLNPSAVIQWTGSMSLD